MSCAQSIYLNAQLSKSKAWNGENLILDRVELIAKRSPHACSPSCIIGIDIAEKAKDFKLAQGRAGGMITGRPQSQDIDIVLGDVK